MLATGSLNTHCHSLPPLSPAARNLAGNPLPPAEEIHRKSAEEILCVSTGNPYKVSLANLPDLLRHHTEQIFQDSLSPA